MTGKIKKVSIIIPCFNTEQFLEDTIKSVLNQTFKKFDLYLIDNGSTDKSLSIMKKYKKGDIVLVKSVAGDAIPNIHVRLLERVVVKSTPGRRSGFKTSMDWPGYSGWEAEIIYQEEADVLRKEWSIPFDGPGDTTFVYDYCIIKKPRKPRSINRKINDSGSVTIRRKRKK